MCKEVEDDLVNMFGSFHIGGFSIGTTVTYRTNRRRKLRRKISVSIPKRIHLPPLPADGVSDGDEGEPPLPDASSPLPPLPPLPADGVSDGDEGEPPLPDASPPLPADGASDGDEGETPFPEEVMPTIMCKYGFPLFFEAFPHQYSAIDWALDKEANSANGVRGGILSLEMGLGKTLVSLVLAMITRDKGPTLFVCGKSLITSAPADAKKFFGSQLKTYVLFGDNVSTFIGETVKDIDMVITTYDVVLMMDRKKKDALFNIDWYRIVADESQRISNPDAKISRAMLRFKPGRRICLTGTPLRNYEYDLYSQFMFCGIEMNNCRWTYDTYRNMKIGANILVINVKDANITLPTKHEHDIWLDFTEDEKKVYSYIHSHAKSIFDNFNNINRTQCFANVLVQFTRMRQACVCCAMVPSDADDAPNVAVESSKFREVLSIITTKKLPDEKIVIFSGFTNALSQLADLLESQDIPTVIVDGSTRKREDRFNLFKNSKHHNVLLISSQVGSVGLNLQHANHVVLLEPWWNSINGKQGEARCHRIGQKKEVHVWRIFIRKSIEAHMLEMCKSKETMSSKFLTTELVSRLL